MSEVDWWTRVTAIYGAVLSTIGGLFQLYRHRKDGARVSVTWRYLASFRAYTIVATNTGGKLVTLNGALMHIKGMQTVPFVVSGEFDKKLAHSEQQGVVFTRHDIAAGHLMQAYKFTVLDSEGREWPLKDFKKLKAIMSAIAPS